jgi:hypothetical protein
MYLCKVINNEKQNDMKARKNKTIFIIDSFTGDVLTSMVIHENSDIPFSFKCEFEMLKEKLGTIVAKQFIEGDEKATIILRD